MKQQKKQLSIIQPACFHPHRLAYSTTTKVMWVTGGSGLAPWVTHPDMDVSGNGQYTHNSWQFTEWETYIISKKKVIPHSRRNSYWSLSWGAVGMPPALLITVYMVKPRHPRSLTQFFSPTMHSPGTVSSCAAVSWNTQMLIWPRNRGYGTYGYGKLKDMGVDHCFKPRNHNQYVSRFMMYIRWNEQWC